MREELERVKGEVEVLKSRCEGLEGVKRVLWVELIRMSGEGGMKRAGEGWESDGEEEDERGSQKDEMVILGAD